MNIAQYEESLELRKKVIRHLRNIFPDTPEYVIIWMVEDAVSVIRKFKEGAYDSVCFINTKDGKIKKMTARVAVYYYNLQEFVK